MKGTGASRGDLGTLARGAGVMLAGMFGSRGLTFLVQIVLARVLGPVLYGVYALGWVILRVMGIVGSFGLDKGVIHFAADRRDRAQVKWTLYQSIGLATILGAGLGIVGFAAAPWVAAEVFHEPRLAPVLRWFSLAFPAVSGGQVAAAATQVSKRMQYGLYARDLGQAASNLLILGIVVAFGGALIGATVAAVGSFFIAFAVGLLFVGKLFRTELAVTLPPPRLSRALLSFSGATFVAALLASSTSWVDRLVLGYFMSSETVGVYQAVFQVSLIFAVVVMAFAEIFTPMVAELHHEGERDRMAELFRISTKWGLYLSMPLLLTVVAAPGAVLGIVFGGAYTGGATALVILTAGQAINVASGGVAWLLLMTRRHVAFLVIAAVTFALNLGLNVMLVSRLGMQGAAIATATATAVLSAAAVSWTRGSLGMWPYDARIWKGVLASAAAGLALIALHRFGPAWGAGSDFAVVATTAALATLVFWGTLVALGLDAEDRTMVRVLRRRLSSA